jgi:hypothetical protein
MTPQLKQDLKDTNEPVNIRTSFLITLATAGAALSGIVELFVLRTTSKGSALPSFRLLSLRRAWLRANGKDSGCLIVRAKRGELMTWSYKNALFVDF